MRALVFQHVPEEGAGLLGTLLENRGIACDTVELYRGDPVPYLADYRLMLVMGGPQQVWETALHPWLAQEMAVIRRWVREFEKPYLGICLGHQLLAQALGGQVAPASRHEIGFPPVSLAPAALAHPLFRVLPPTARWLQWHTAEVTRVPTGFEVMASSRDCAVQAMALGSRAISLQFHAEGTEGLVDYWTSHPDTLAEMERLNDDDLVARVLAESADHIAGANRNAALLVERWLELNPL